MGTDVFLLFLLLLLHSGYAGQNNCFIYSTELDIYSIDGDILYSTWGDIYSTKGDIIYCAEANIIYSKEGDIIDSREVGIIYSAKVDI